MDGHSAISESSTHDTAIFAESSLRKSVETQLHAVQATLQLFQAKRHAIFQAMITQTGAVQQQEQQKLLRLIRSVLGRQNMLFLESVMTMMDQAADEEELALLEGAHRAVIELMRAEITAQKEATASEKWITSLVTVKIDDIDSECAICLCNLEPGSEGNAMPCKHVFHLSCIGKWLQVRGSCPVC